MDHSEYNQMIAENGYTILEEVLGEAELRAWETAVKVIECGASRRKSSANARMPAARNLLALDAVRKLATSPVLLDCVKNVLGSSARPVRGILFNKVAGANWKVTWHQDRAIAVQRRIHVQGFGPWSVKQHVPHVEPPTAILENMLTLRLHLDDCFEDNGPLRVIPGSHRLGKLDETAIAELREARPIQTCTVRRGGILVMRPLLLHASSPATKPASRRVVHLEYAADALPAGLQWFSWDDADASSGRHCSDQYR